MRGVVENAFRFVGGELQAPDPENHQDQTVARTNALILSMLRTTPFALTFNPAGCFPSYSILRQS
jgi:hypothetical protein